MIALPAGVQVWLAPGATDLRRASMVWRAWCRRSSPRIRLRAAVRVPAGRHGDRIKILWWDGDGLYLFAKRLERGRFVWPQATHGTVSLSGAQLSMLLEGIDWRRPERTFEPQLAV